MARIKIKAQVRDKIGTSNARRLRRSGVVPGILYGEGRESIPLGMDGKDIHKALKGRGGEHTIIELRIEGGALEKPLNETVIIKEVQRDPIMDTVSHVDFAAISMTEKLTASVPVVDTGEAAGVAVGGVLEHILRELEVECLPDDLPERIVVDVSALGIGDSINVSAITPPAGVKILNSPDLTVFTVSMPKVEKVEVAAEAEEAAAAEAAPAEGEEKKPEEAKEEGKGKEKEPSKGKEKE